MERPVNMLLKLNSRGADVRLLQLQLRALGYDVASHRPVRDRSLAAEWIDKFTPRTYYRPYGVISLPDGSYDHLGSGPRPRVRIED